MSEALVDVQRVLRGLKDFQQASADYIFRRMYLDHPAARRFLLADEVGLGKTLVARGVVAKAIEHLKDTVQRIDILYICSNQDIARQNIRKLNVTDEEDFSLASRITMLPVHVKDLKSRRINLLTFTPSTSFNLRSNLGTAGERALLYWMLEGAWTLKGTGPQNVLQGYAGVESFRERVKEFRNSHDIDELLTEQYRAAIARRCEEDKAAEKPDLRSRFEALCDKFGYARKNIPEDEHAERTAVVGELRAILASSCLEALEPDFIILDEFQRFRDLLDGDDDASVLARNLFEYKDARVLLLSATPYKMYTIEDEAGTDDHYKDFVRTYRFLAGNGTASADLETLLSQYRRDILNPESIRSGSFRSIKALIEVKLRGVMCRTERLAADPERSGMLMQVPLPPSPVSSADLSGYVALQSVAEHLDQGETIEYWKSTPYPLNFMEEYQLKESFNEAPDDRELSAKVASVLRSSRGLLLDWNAVESYSEVDPANARLRGLIADTVDRGAWRTLWMLPALPYYTPRPPFDGPLLRDFTKRLIFSSWKVVPKAVAALLSLEAERRMVRSFSAEARNTPEDRKRRKPLLRFSVSDERLTGLPLLSLIYPSTALTDLCDPLHVAASPEYWDRPPDASLVLDVAKLRIERALGALPQFREAPRDGQEDETWYWAAPVLLDAAADRTATEEWWIRKDLATAWSGEDAEAEPDEEDGDTPAWARHVETAQTLFLKGRPLGRPPSDLSAVLAYVSLASPGVTALRTLRRIAGANGNGDQLAVRLEAGRIGRRFVSLFNQPEATAVIRGLNPEEPFWKRVLEYCFAGNLQSVLDEYAHVLHHSLGLIDKKPADVAAAVAEAVEDSLSLRAAAVGVDRIAPAEDGKSWAQSTARLRMRFALRFGDEKAEDGSVATRADQVRSAFNSPFWPFVLVTTSIGQEGLDFHHYCHAVVHWNLPSNPVDLEQREGRVHRYKGHAIRKNLALKHADDAFAKPTVDPWHVMFEKAIETRDNGFGDLFPYWILPVEGGARIERHTPAPALSRDLSRLAALRKALAVYRMVFGQPRQEELLDYLSSHFPPEQLASLSAELRIDLSPPKTPGSLHP
ncbi:MAG TPA: helicase-related protein [Thermoanaerobaculia bacterium]|nr:helicase-related protein [Thermoanaerobaculia bacterium]